MNVVSELIYNTDDINLTKVNNIDLGIPWISCRVFHIQDCLTSVEGGYVVYKFVLDVKRDIEKQQYIARFKDQKSAIKEAHSVANISLKNYAYSIKSKNKYK